MNRLEFISSLTKGYDSLCDIGCDHGYICINAINNYRVKKAYALDINEGPLNNALKNIKKANLEDKIEVVLSDGLKNFKYEADLYLISGMGGNIIKNIIDSSLDKFKKAKAIIIEANNYESIVRKYLFEHGFKIKNEFIIKDSNKIYEIMIAIYEKCSYDDLDILFGPILRIEKSPIFIEKYENKLQILKQNFKKATDASKLNIQNKINLLETVLYKS